jgi:predicted nucleic acid-binding protein
MLPADIFIDTEILLDYIIPDRRTKFMCSCLLVEEISKGNLKALTADYVLSEIMGKLKSEKEQRKGTGHIQKETLNTTEKIEIQRIVQTVKDIPNLKIFTPTRDISQQEIYEIVRNTCVQTKDALVLLTALDAKNKYKNLGLITRDEKLLIRSKSKIISFHPSDYINKCPPDCVTKGACHHRK